MPQKIFIFSILILGIVHFSFAQDNKQLPIPGENLYSLTGYQNDPQLTSVQPAPQQFSAEKQGLLDRLREARLNHDSFIQKNCETRLMQIDGTQGVDSPSDPNIQVSEIYNQEMGANSDFNNATVAGISHWNHAVATVPAGTLSGRIYLATGHYNSSGSDSCKIYYSSNGGVSWVYYTQWYYAGFNMDMRSSEMDIKILYDGTTAWLYGVTPFHDNTANNNRVTLWRFNLTTNAFYGITMAWPGAVATTSYYNARLCSDDAIYGASGYLYITASFDSLYSGTLHHLKQKFCLIQNPFAATPTTQYKNPNGTGGFFWNGTGYPANAYYYNDVAYYNPTGVDRIFTVISVNVSFNLMYLAWSNDLGSTIAGSLTLAESTPTRGATLDAVVAAGNQTLMLVNTKNFSGTDWDVEYHVTTTGGTTAGAWTTNFVDFTGFQASGYPDVVWVRGTTNNFKCAYTEDSTAGTTRAFYAGWNGTAWTTPSRLALSTIEADSTFATPVAGYRNGGGDNCLEIWSGQSVGVINASYLCQGTVGINGNNNGIPEVYSLSQNYPNPFNPATSINFAIPKSGAVKLSVYDITGKIVATLVNAQLEAGNHSINFDASNIASGMYFYKIEAGEFKDTKKMVLIK